MIKLLIGGSPCTYWSIAKKNGRETAPEGLGWELFKNYLIAKDKFKPDFFLYENNKSAAQPIKDQIKHELGVWDGTLFSEDTGARYIEINSALVSAQNRQRFYVHNCGEVEQPHDRGIMLRDILETGQPYGSTNGKSYARTATYYKGQPANMVLEKSQRTMVAEPVRVGSLPRPDGKLSNSQGKRIYSVDGKSVCLSAAKSGGNGDACSPATGLYAVPLEPVRIGTIENSAKNTLHDSKQYRVYSPDAKSTTLCARGGGMGAKTGLYAVPYCGTVDRPIYEVKRGKITIKGKEYPIKLLDGFYIIRKLTVTECSRIQTLPDDYCRAVSDSQAYKGLGNGWTAEVIIHILSGALSDIPRDEKIVVLSMYDGIGTGRYCLDKMGFTNVEYYAYEIDKFAMQIAKSNYPDIIHMGDAFELRHPDWTIGY